MDGSSPACPGCAALPWHSFRRSSGEKRLFFFYLLIPVGLVVLFRLLRRGALNGFKGLLFFLAGAALIYLVNFPPIPPSHIFTHGDQGMFWVRGRVKTLFPEQCNPQGIVLAATAVGRKRSGLLPATGLVKLTIRDGSSHLAYDDELVVHGTIRRLRNFANPGGFDYVRFMKHKGILVSLYCRGPDLFFQVPPAVLGWPVTLVRRVAGVRNAFSRHIHGTIKDPHCAALLDALVLGNRKQLSQDIQDTFARSGASHILCISGLHFSIVATLFFFLFQRLLCLFTPLLIRGLARKGAALMTLVPLAGYALISGFSPATQRALIMVSALMISLVMERENITLNSLAAAAIVILIFQPAALLAVSFQLSFAAVFSIVCGLDLARRRQFPSFGNTLVNRGAIFFLVSLLAIVGTQPLVMRYFNMVSPAGLFTNVVTIPGVGFGVLPLGLLSFLLFPFSAAASTACLSLAGAVAGPCISFLSWGCHLPGAWARTVTPDLYYLVAWYLLMGALYVWLRWETRKTGLLLGGAAFLILLINGAVDVRQRYFSKALDITVLDVGQGNSALIRLPKGACFLVDGGGFPGSSVFDTGRYLVAPFLWQQNILSLAGVVLTHPDSDHMNGLLYILENFRVKVLYKNGDQGGTEAYRRLMFLARSRGIPIHQVDSRGEVMAVTPEITWRFLPGFREDGRRKDELKKNYNDNSLVLKVNFRQFSMLFPADIMALREARLVASQGTDLKSSLLLVPHHGSGTSSTALFLDRVQPEAALVSCGWHNRFKFPHSRVVKRYRQREIPLYRTDQDGSLHIVSDGITWHIEPTRKAVHP